MKQKFLHVLPHVHASPQCGAPGWVQAYFMLDEMLVAGELQEPSKKAVTRVIEVQDQLVEAAKQGGQSVPAAGLAGVPTV